MRWFSASGGDGCKDRGFFAMRRLCVILAVGSCSFPSAAQPAPGSPNGAFVLPPVARPDDLPRDIEVAGFAFAGNTVFSSADLQRQIADFSGRRLQPGDFDDLRNRISRFYVDAGYLNSGALVAALPPSGRYADDIVPIQVIEGRIESVNIRNLNGLQQRYVESRLLRDDEILNVNLLQERFRLLLTDPLFDKINSRIIPGDRLGAAVLDIDIVRARPYALNVFVNNYRPPSVGAVAAGASGLVRNLTGAGDVLDATVQHSQGATPLHLGWSVPFGSRTRVFASYDRSTSSVIEESLRSIDIGSRTAGFESGIGQTLVDTLVRHVDVGLSYGRRRSDTTLLGRSFSFTPGEPDGLSKVQVWRVSQNWTERWDKQALAARSVFAFGTNNIDPDLVQGAATDPQSIPARRYALWTGQAQYVHTVLDNGAQLLLRGSAQYTRDRLLPIEQFSLGGIGSVRGYRENAVLRDRAYVASVELRYPLWPDNDERRSLALTTFGDLGGGANRGEPRQRLSSVGVGVSWRQFGFIADLCYARKLSKLPTETTGNLQDHGIHFQLGYQVF